MNKQKLSWSFDISAYRLLGRELITDKITALFELVKNAYDANSTTVSINFNFDDSLKCTEIVIEDNGFGMTEKDIKNKWMVIGSSNKRKRRVSPPPLNRKLVGKKGIGRFAIDKLGSYVKLITRPIGSSKINHIVIDWSKYEKEEAEQLRLFDEDEKVLFTDIENDFWQSKATENYSGTRIEISKIRENWTEDDFNVLISELSKLASPYSKISDNFRMYVTALPFNFNKLYIKNEAIKYATHRFELGYDLQNRKQESLFFNEEDCEIEVKEEDFYNFGPVKMVLYYFDKLAKARFKKNTINQSIDGVKIYRDGLITTPFAESSSELDHQKDVLGLDKRRWSGFFSKISSRDLIGFIEITDNENPEIEESTNRQGFINNAEYESLKSFFYTQISAIENFLQALKQENREETTNDLKTAKVDLKQIKETLTYLNKIVPKEAKAEIKVITSNLKLLEKSINRGISNYKEIELEKKRQENLFFSLMSLQEYASEIAHMVRTSIAKISRYANFFYEEYPNKKYEDLYGDYAHSIYKEMMALSNALDFMLSYSKSNITFQNINIFDLISDLVRLVYQREIDKYSIDIRTEIEDSIEIFHNKKFFEDIFQNLIDNSIKSLKKSDNNKKIIVIKGIQKSEEFIFNIIDNGIGIEKKYEARIFNVFFTTTAEEGGGGIGLFSVKKRVQSMNGTIKVVPNLYFNSGVNFEIKLPINRNK